MHADIGHGIFRNELVDVLDPSLSNDGDAFADIMHISANTIMISSAATPSNISPTYID